MSIFKNNIKISFLEKHELRCECGSIKYNIEIFEGENDKGNFIEPWIMITCKKCKNILFYNGA